MSLTTKIILKQNGDNFHSCVQTFWLKYKSIKRQVNINFITHIFACLLHGVLSHQINEFTNATNASL